jgi:putative SOS response-associated peptidase YedK
MCGRYVSVQSDADLVEEFDVEEVVGDPVPPSYNVAPTDVVRGVVERVPKDAGDADTVRQLRTLRWGLVPTWSRDAKGGARMINARVETVTSKPAFKAAAARRRCLLPALGYYEWAQRDDGGKAAFFLHDPDGRPLAMAGLYELWRDPAKADDDPARWLWTCTVITRPATDVLGHIHDRCPVLVPEHAWSDWLDCRSDDPATADAILRALPEPHLQPDRVSDAVGNVRNNGPELIEPRPGDVPEPQQLF